MLDLCMTFLAAELNTHLQGLSSGSTDRVTLGAIVDEQGKYSFEEQSLRLSTINIREERVLRQQSRSYTDVGGLQVVNEPPLHLQVQALIAARFRVHSEALKHLSQVLAYLQRRPVFTPQSHPALDPRFGRLSVELQSLTYEELNQVWAFVGGKALPAVFYTIGVVVLRDEQPTEVSVPITEISAALGRR